MCVVFFLLFACVVNRCVRFEFCCCYASPKSVMIKVVCVFVVVGGRCFVVLCVSCVVLCLLFLRVCVFVYSYL